MSSSAFTCQGLIGISRIIRKPAFRSPQSVALEVTGLFAILPFELSMLLSLSSDLFQSSMHRPSSSDIRSYRRTQTGFSFGHEDLLRSRSADILQRRTW
jgi:hypothetical protein